MPDPRIILEARIKELNREFDQLSPYDKASINANLREVGELNRQIAQLDATLPPRVERID